jgi:hypothetical protein
LLFQAHPRRRPRAQRATAAVLAVPVLGLVYAQAAARRLSPIRPAALVIALLIGSIGLSLIGGHTATAERPYGYQPLERSAFVPVPPILGAANSAGYRTGGATPDTADRPASVGVTPAQVEAPSIVRFRPRNGQTGISRFAGLSVRFTQPMDEQSGRRAFSATVGRKKLSGTYYWAEGDTVLVLIPRSPLPAGARVTLAMNRAALSADGARLTAAGRVTFRVVPAPTPHRSSQGHVRHSVGNGWRWPLIGPITQYFGQTLTRYGFHQGIDINGATGDPVRAAKSGVVTVAGYWDSCGGLQVHIDHGNGFVSWYRHLSHIDVRVGQRVTAGTIIGRVGATGCSFGSHLHFGISLHSVFVDPLRYLPRR